MTTRLALLSTLLITLSGCMSLYHPNAVQTPLFTNAGEVHAAAHAGLTGGDVQVAYSPLDNVAVLGAASYNSNALFSSTGNDDEVYRYAEASLGYYAPHTGMLRTEIFAGMGVGSSVDHPNVEFPDEVYSYRASFQRYFMQGTMGASDHFGANPWQREFGLALRLAYLHFQEVHAGDERLNVPGALFVEPALFGRVGREGVMMEAQLGGSWTPSSFRFDWQYLRFTLGLHVAFGRASY
jgi:hypothetical protein